MLMDISKAKDNYNKDRRPKCFNCNKYGYMAKDYQKKKENNTRKCFKYEQTSHIIKNCKMKQLMKNKNIQEESDKEDKKQDFGENPE